VVNVFTGLVADLGRVVALQEGGDGAVLEVATPLAGELGVGDSVAVNGVCLTATAVTGDGFSAQAMHETLARTSLGRLRTGSAVNLELALRADGRLGGHIVQGHVDATATVTGWREEGFARVLAVAAEAGVLRYLVEKGSIAIDGVSLTVSRLHEAGFEVSLIPETLQRTTLGALEVGEEVNLEVDVLAKHVERLIGGRALGEAPAGTAVEAGS
jgi:riboflavin synthase